MSLDLYCGSLGKFYQRDFETPQQRFGREQGFSVKTVYTAEQPEWLTPDNVEQVIGAFKIEIFGITGEVAPEISKWNENCSDYLTEQLFQECLQALLLVTAYTYRPELTRPTKLPYDIDTDIAISEASEKNYYIGPIAIFESHLFLPDDSERIFACSDPMGWNIVATTTKTLSYALNYLSEKIWGNDIDPEGWFSRGPVPKGASMTLKKSILPWKKTKWVSTEETHNIEDEVLWNAEYAFSVFHKMLDFAQANNVPIRQDG